MLVYALASQIPTDKNVDIFLCSFNFTSDAHMNFIIPEKIF